MPILRRKQRFGGSRQIAPTQRTPRISKASELLNRATSPSTEVSPSRPLVRTYTAFRSSDAAQGRTLPFFADIDSCMGAVNDFLLDRPVPHRRQSIRESREPPFIAALTQNASRRNVCHHVVRIPRDPRPVRAQFRLQPQTNSRPRPRHPKRPKSIDHPNPKLG